MAIKCCNGCVPPERNAYCHSTCNKYLEEKAEYEAKKAVCDKQRAIKNEIYAQRTKKVREAMSHRRKGKL